MQRPRAHDVDELAQRIFESALPRDWVPREQHPDYGIDYVVEIFEGGNSTGLQFAVQLKGTETVRVTAGTPLVRLKVCDLAYYVDKVRQPVFVVLVDVRAERGYWLFCQAYALDELQGRSWRSRDTVTLHIPGGNDLADSQGLRDAVERAVARMAELHPAAIEGAIAAERTRLKSVDPRFDVQIEVEGGKPHYHFSAKQAVHATFKIKGRPDDVRPKVEALIERGEPITVSPGEVEVIGMPLLDEFAIRGGTMQFSRERDVTMRVTPLDAEGRALGGPVYLGGKLQGGSREVQCECALERSLLVLHFAWQLAAKRGATQFGLRWNRAPWDGQPLLRLPYFEQLYALFEGIEQLARLDIVLEDAGNRIFSGNVVVRDKLRLLPLSSVLTCLRKARELAQHFRLNPRLPSDFGPEHQFEIEVAYGLFRDREYRRPAHGDRCALRLAVEGLRNLLARPDDLLKVGTLSASASGPLPFLGTSIDVGPFDIEFTDAQCDSTREELQRLAETATSDTVGLDFVGTEASTMTFRRYPGG